MKDGSGMQVMENRGYIPQLDGIRAIAILSVLLTHTWITPQWPIVNKLAEQAQAGVDIFFVLSGFLITGVLLSARNKEGYYFTFYARRALRIFPVFFLVLTLIFVAWPASPYLIQPREHWPYYFLFAANIILAITGPQLKLTDITWSLSVEEQFYLFWPTVVRRISERTLLRVCIFIIAIVPLLRFIAHGHLSPFAIHVLTPFRIDEFAAGALICVVSRRDLMDAVLLRRIGYWLGGVAGTLFVVVSVMEVKIKLPWYDDVLQYSLIGAAASGLLLVALYSRRAAGLLQAPWLMHIGKVSYGMYLYHAILVVFVSKAVGFSPLPDGHPALTSGAMFMLVTILTVWIATLSYRYFELPFLKMKRFFPVKVDPKNVLAEG